MSTSAPVPHTQPSTYYTTNSDTIQAAVTFTPIYAGGTSPYQVKVEMFGGDPTASSPIATNTFTLKENGDKVVITGLYVDGINVYGYLSLRGYAIEMDGYLVSPELETNLNGLVGAFYPYDNANTMCGPISFGVDPGNSNPFDNWGLEFGLKWNYTSASYDALFYLNKQEGSAILDGEGNGTIDYSKGDLAAKGTIIHADHVWYFTGAFIRSSHAQFGFINGIFTGWRDNPHK